MKYVFFIKKISDFDHLLPIAIGLTHKGIDHKNLKFIEIYPDLSLINIHDDFRYNFLKKNKIIIKKLFFSSQYLKLIRFFNYILKKNFFFKYFLIIIIKILKNLVFYLCKTRLSLILKINDIQNIIIDHSTSDLEMHLVSIAKMKKIKIFSFPHGSVLHDGYKDKFFHRLQYKKKYDAAMFTNIVFSNKYHQYLSNFKNTKNNSLVLGSIRYSKEWINFLKKNFKMKKSTKKLRILLFEEKKGANISKHYVRWINFDEIKKIIDYLIGLDNCKLTISKHPSIVHKSIFEDNSTYYSKKSTFELVLESDIVIGCLTSSLLDSILLNKRTIFLPYCHYFNNKLDNILPKSYLANNFDEFRKILNKNIDDIMRLKKNNFQKKFYREFINHKDENIFENYNKLLINN